MCDELGIMKRKVKERGRRIKDYTPGTIIHVQDKMQSGYSYVLTAAYGDVTFDRESKYGDIMPPDLMLKLGIFGGKYMNDCIDEFPREWFEDALKEGRLSPCGRNYSLNAFGVKAGISRREWIEKGWITEDDPDVRGWFQWYARYYIGRREPDIDQRQIKRWKSFARHAGGLVKRMQSDSKEYPAQRQALLQWGYKTAFR